MRFDLLETDKIAIDLNEKPFKNLLLIALVPHSYIED